MSFFSFFKTGLADKISYSPSKTSLALSTVVHVDQVSCLSISLVSFFFFRVFLLAFVTFLDGDSLLIALLQVKTLVLLVLGVFILFLLMLFQKQKSK